MEIAKRSRGTPRIANRLLKRVRDFAEVMGNGKITKEMADIALSRLEIDKLGLDSLDKRSLTMIINGSMRAVSYAAWFYIKDSQRQMCDRACV